MDRHIRIEYAAGATFDYRVSATAAELLESSLRDWAPDAEITIDDQITDELAMIPCATLWEP
ncbi:hypothetical protein [Nocardia asteroides]|uniref:hypothetical protein n=1 Tax=Nocardia asteroides TaxID=1824 RepID=UPI001E2E60F0|nr:hypothetical protein [Nocardia asteroides]UGT63315.1 hypothetical protein LTT61_08400 [Nocardia asteroides]